MNQKTSCFVINLEKDVERRVQISHQLDDLGIPHTIFAAVHGASLTAEEMDSHYDRKRAVALSHDMTRSEIGCALSHIYIYRKMVAEGIQYALVLEDDARLSDDLPHVISCLQDEYASAKPTVIILGHVRKYQNRSALILDEKYRVAEIYGTPVGAHGYFITLAGAKKLLDNLYPVWAVADDWAVFNERFVTIKALVPYCIGLSEFAQISNLEAERQDIKLKRSIRYHVQHYFYHKFINQIFVRPFQRVKKQDQTW